MHLTWIPWFKLNRTGSSVDFCTGASKSETERQRSMSALHLCCRLDIFFGGGGGGWSWEVLPIRTVSNAALQHLLCPETQGQSSSFPDRPVLSLSLANFLSFCFKQSQKAPAQTYFIMLLFVVTTVTLFSVLSVFGHGLVSVQKKKEINNWMAFSIMTNHLDSFVSHTAYNWKMLNSCPPSGGSLTL